MSIFIDNITFIDNNTINDNRCTVTIILRVIVMLGPFLQTAVVHNKFLV